MADTQHYLLSNKQSNQLELTIDEESEVTPPPSSPPTLDIERIISIAYQIAFLCEPSESILRRLRVCGLERALEIILTMRQSPNVIRNPEAFIKKAIVMGWSPNTLLRRQNNKKKEQPEQSVPSEPVHFYNWLEEF